jgi:ABC-type antimicrobial peptide transport system permease subunit
MQQSEPSPGQPRSVAFFYFVSSNSNVKYSVMKQGYSRLRFNGNALIVGILMACVGVVLLIVLGVFLYDGAVHADSSGTSGRIPTYQLVIGLIGLLCSSAGAVLAYRASRNFRA